MRTPEEQNRELWPVLLGAPLLALACTQAQTPRDVFDAEVRPILERQCAATICHGVAPDAELQGETIDWDQLVFRLDGAGRFADPDRAYEAAKRTIDTVEGPELSTLLRKPLSVRRGGLGHFGGESFSSPSDPSYRAIYGWIALEEGGGEDPEPLTDSQVLFANTVQPVLSHATCMTSHCHGPTAGGIPYRLDLGYEGRFSNAATRHNYAETLAVASLDGYPLLSRVIRKSQPLGAGIVHKGLNFDFYAGEPTDGVAALTRWICAERRERSGHDCAGADALPISGFVYVRGPVASGHPFDLDVFVPGSDLFLARVDPLVVTSTANLTAFLHPSGPADVRDPAVSRDETQVLFAMRTSRQEGHHLWVLELVTGRARQLTSGNGALPGGGMATDRDPTWGPDGSIWFASTRAGAVADQGERLDADLYSLDPSTGALRRWTFTPHVERKPVFFDIGDEAGGEVAFSALRDAIPDQARAHIFRFPPSLRTEYHQHFGITPLATLIYDMRELPDGRYVSVIGELTSRWQAGGLAIVDRNFGPEINARSQALEPALELYRPPMVTIADGGYRDPAPLPDGRILAAHQADPAATAFTPRIELLELVEQADGAGPTLSRTTVLLDEPGAALTDPEPISTRAPVRAEPALPPSDETTAIFRHQGVPMIHGLLANLSPSGTKTPLEGAAYVRLVEHLPLTIADRSPVPGQSGGTSVALGRHGPARILAELPLQVDGSFQARVPVGVPFRVQALDVSRMAIGTMHNRWFYTLPGQILTQGISVAAGMARYGSRCAACHGDPGGVARAPELEAPDAVTSASRSSSRHERQNPRRPIGPPVLGAPTRIELDFVRDVQPILDRRCVRCHGHSTPAAGLDLSGTPTERFTRAYEGLLASGAGSGGGRAYVDDGDGRARSSVLVERLSGRELDARGSVPTPGVAHPEPHDGPVTPDELLTVVRWIELGATFRGGAPHE